MPILSARERIMASLKKSRPRLVQLCQSLVQIDSQNPPGNSEAIIRFIVNWLGERPDVEFRQIASRPGVLNLVVLLRNCRPGRRLVMNGHLDTFPVGDERVWSIPPFGGVLTKGRLYGRGASDMKAGIAAAMLSLDVLWHYREHLCGELALVFASDEETGGIWGTKYLLDNVPEARGDAMLSGDAGSPRIARFGEKGQMWIELRASGKSAHGAHVHLGRNAIVQLIESLRRILQVESLCVSIPERINRAISAAAPVSESLSGTGETKVLRSVTVNIGSIVGGGSVNVVPDAAGALVDLRYPPGVSSTDIKQRIQKALEGLDRIEWKVFSQCEPNWTEPDHEIVRLVIEHATNLVGEKIVSNMRVGFSDARYYRAAGIPAIVYGPTPFNMGGADEYVLVSELETVTDVHALVAYDYLSVEK